MSLDHICKAIGDESRKKIIELLRTGEMPASAIFDQFSYAAPTISRHLSVLKDAELVLTRREGVFIYYSLNLEKMQELNEWTSSFLPAKQKEKAPLKERNLSTRKSKVEHPFDKFQSEF